MLAAVITLAEIFGIFGIAALIVEGVREYKRWTSNPDWTAEGRNRW